MSLFFLQAKYLAQIIVMGVQVVGRAFARALQQEYAGMVKMVKRLAFTEPEESSFVKKKL